jgi:hypothetical protein
MNCFCNPNDSALISINVPLPSADSSIFACQTSIFEEVINMTPFQRDRKNRLAKLSQKPDFMRPSSETLGGDSTETLTTMADEPSNSSCGSKSYPKGILKKGNPGSRNKAGFKRNTKKRVTIEVIDI